LLFYDTLIPDLSMQNSFPGKKGYKRLWLVTLFDIQNQSKF